MDVAAFDQSIIDHALAVFLRYLKGSERLDVDNPILDVSRDRELLRLYWSLSGSVAELASYVLENRHEVQSVLNTVVRHEDGLLRGRLDAYATVRLRRTSGLPTTVVSHEPVRSFSSGPNQVLGWVLMEAWSLATRFSTMTIDSPAYQEQVHRARQRLDQCRRLHSIAEIAGETILNRRPTAAALVEAGRARRTLYRMARKAYTDLLAIEAGDPSLIKQMLKESLIGPLEPWKRFELAVGLSVGEALASAQGARLSLNLMIGEMRRNLARCGRFAVFWQDRTDYFRPPSPEPSEIVEAKILKAYGLTPGGDRPDLIVVDLVAKRVAAIVEVKYLTQEDASDRVRSAIRQLVRYARGYVDIEDIDELLTRSLAMMSTGTGTLVSPAENCGVPAVMDFAGVNGGQLAAWASRVLQ